MKKILVFGANGYLARNLVFVLKRDHPDFSLTLYGCEESSIDGHDNYFRVDMTDITSVNNVDLCCDVIFMFVGKTGTEKGFYDYDSFINVNEKSLLNLLLTYQKQKSQARIVFPSTRLIYKGKPKLLKETSKKEFKTIYAINKFACEKYLEQYHSIFNIQYSIFRICLPYGTLVPNASSYGTVEFMISKANNGEDIILYGNGKAKRTLTHIEDLCKTLIAGSISKKCANDVFNIGGEEYSLSEIANLISIKYGVNVKCVPWPKISLKIESGNTVFDSTKLDKKIGSFINHKFSDWLN